MPQDFSYLDSERIATLFPDPILVTAEGLVAAGAVHDMAVGPVELTGAIIVGQERFVVVVTAKDNRFVVSCACGTPGGRPCVHVAALLMERALRGEAHPGGAPRPTAPPPERTVFPVPALPPQPPPLPGAGPAPTPEEEYRQLLSALTVGQMRSVAARRGVKLSGTRRDAILSALAAGLCEPGNVRAAVESLSPEARLALQLAVLASLPRVASRNPVEAHSHLLSQALTARKAGRAREQCLDELDGAGLLFRSHSQLKVPAVVVANLPPATGVLAEHSGGPPGRVELAAPMALSRLAVRLLLQAQAGELEFQPSPVGPDGWPESGATSRAPGQEPRPVPPALPMLDQRTLETLTAATGLPADRLDYLARVLAGGKLWGPGKERTLLVSAPALVAFLQLDPPAQGRYLFQLALALPDQTEMDMARTSGQFAIRRYSYYGGASYSNYLRTLIDARAVCFEVLALAPAGRWLEVGSLLHTLHQLVGNPFASGYGAPFISLLQGNNAVSATNYRDWSQTFGQVFQALLAGPAHWLGMCDLGWQRDRLEAFRLTEFGAYLLKQRDSFPLPVRPPDAAPAVTFDADSVIRLDPGAAAPQVLSLVPLLGDLQAGGQPPRSERARKRERHADRWLAYRLTPAGALRAFEAGWTARSVIATLTEAAGIEPTIEIAERLERWGANYGRLHLYDDLAMIEFNDDFALPELLAGTGLSRHLLYRFNPRLIAVRPENIEALFADLEAKGYTPRRADG